VIAIYYFFSAGIVNRLSCFTQMRFLNQLLFLLCHLWFVRRSPDITQRWRLTSRFTLHN